MLKLHIRRIGLASSLLVILLVFLSGIRFLAPNPARVVNVGIVNTAHQWYRGVESIMDYKVFVEQRKKEDSVMRLELGSWSPPDLHPTARQWRRGPPDDFFGKYYTVCQSWTSVCPQFISIK